MLHQAYITNWHQIFLVAAGFLTAILLVWIQTRQSAFYNEKDDPRCEQDRLFSSNIVGLWLSTGVLFALLAFGLTGLDLLFPYQTECMKWLAAGFLISAFDITLIEALEVIYTAGRVLKKKGAATQIRINYTDEKKECLLIAVCIALFLVLAFSLLLAFMPPSWWLWLALCSVIIPGLILLVAYKCISCQRSSQDPCRLRDFILSWGKDCHRFCHKNR